MNYDEIKQVVEQPKNYNGLAYVVSFSPIYLPNCLLGCRKTDRIVYDPRSNYLYFPVVDNHGNSENVLWYQMDCEVKDKVRELLQDEKKRIEFEELKQTIQDKVGTDFIGEVETEELLTDIVGKKATCDTCIDDGVDDEDSEDCYVMKSCFSFSGSTLTVRIYYGDVTGKIGWIDVKC